MQITSVDRFYVSRYYSTLQGVSKLKHYQDFELMEQPLASIWVIIQIRR